ncbi:MAG: hypothetical protein Tp1100SUR639781_38 [Prokaryotic dsDNA virus sp.]|jgi:hypothetical protein|nr:MAG: hypothetical protein Tp1100SUR639781_38 [Prokaryotic dsDNA virus sp.]|tara:strand:+ start:4940 stop:5371 length:432 start_codon:yes stop_codon:yes gene_type:complete
MNILTTEINTKLGIQMKNIQMKHHKNYNDIDEPKRQHPIVRQRYKLKNKGRYISGSFTRIKVDTSVLVQYLKKHSIRFNEFGRFTEVSQQTTEILLRMDLRYKYVTVKVVRKIADYLYNNMEEGFKIDIKQLIPDEWENFTDE